MNMIEDSRIPGLLTALNPDAVMQLLVENFPEFREGFEALEARIVDVQYKPGTQCLILYRIKFHMPGAQRSRRQQIAVEALPAGTQPAPIPPELVARYKAMQNQHLLTPYAFIPKTNIAILAFPLDPVLSQLCDIMDCEIMKRKFHELWRERRMRVRQVIPSLLAYTPRSRATVLYEILSESKDTALPEIRYVIGKIHKSRPAWKLFAGAWSLWRASKLRVRLAPPAGYIGTLNMTLQERCPGVRLGDMAGETSFTNAVRQTGRSIAMVHGLSVPTVSKRTPQREAHSVHRWGSVVATLQGVHSSDIEQLCNRLASQLEQRTQMKGLVHGDFHPANVLVDDSRITLIDLDQMALGDPLVDVGRFLASQRVSSLRVHGNLDGLSHDAGHFLERYLACTGEDESRVRLFEAAALVTSAATGFRLQRPGWEENASLIVDEANRVLKMSEHLGDIYFSPADKGRDREKSSEIDWSGDQQYMQAVLDPYITDIYDAELKSCGIRIKADTPEHKQLCYRLRGICNGRKWNTTLNGMVWRNKSGRSAHRRLGYIRGAMEDIPDAPLLPRPITYLPEMRLQVLQLPEGTSLESILGTTAGVDAAEQTAHALLKLHSVRADQASPGLIDREIERVERRLAKLRDSEPSLYRQVMVIWEGVKQRIRNSRRQTTPVLRCLPLDHILCSKQGIAFTDVSRITYSDPMLDFADLLTRLTLLQFNQPAEQGIRQAAERIRAICLSSCDTPEDLAAFELMKLLQASAKQADRHITGKLLAQRLPTRFDRLLAAS